MVSGWMEQINHSQVVYEIWPWSGGRLEDEQEGLSNIFFLSHFDLPSKQNKHKDVTNIIWILFIHNSIS